MSLWTVWLWLFWGVVAIFGHETLQLKNPVLNCTRQFIISNKISLDFFFFLIWHTMVCVFFLFPEVHSFIIVCNGNRATESNVHKMRPYTVGRGFYGRGRGCYWKSLRWLLYDSLALKEWQNAKSQHVRKWSFDIPHSSATSTKGQDKCC